MNRCVEAGTNFESFSQPELSIKHDKAGRIAWSIPGASPEENEKIGIGNIQAMFLERFPEFNKMFPRDENGAIEKDKKEEAEKYIIDHIGKATSFTSAFGGSFGNRQTTPYFEGSHLVAMSISFSSWGLSINTGYQWAKMNPSQICSTIENQVEKMLIENTITTLNDLRGADNGLFTAIYKYYPGKLRGLAQKVGQQLHSRPSGYWNDDGGNKIREEALAVVNQFGKISPSLLRDIGNANLTGVIARYYPGGWRQLRSDLGLAEVRQRDGYWTEEHIRKEALNFLKDQNGELTHGVLRSKNKSALSNAIHQKYKGGMPQLLVDLGLESQRKFNGYWTNSTIEDAAVEAYKKYGHFSATTLRIHGLSTLSVIISKKYPGGFKALREKIGINSARNIRNYWTNEQVEKEALTFYLKHGKLTHTHLLQQKLNSLSIYVSKYPGGILGLKKRLGIETDSEITMSTTQANEQLRGLLEGGSVK